MSKQERKKYMVFNDIDLKLVKPNSSKARRLAIHIRTNKISEHPAIIIGEDGNTYLFLPMTTHPIAKTTRLSKNPNPNSRKPSYVIFRMRANKKSAFSAPLNWRLSLEDYKKIEEYAKRKIK